MPKNELQLVFSKRQLKALLALALLLGAAGLMSETLTLVATYPAPSAVYNQMVATGSAFLARDPGGKVGIGTTNPQFLLDVNGIANVVQLSLNGHLIPSLPAGTQSLAWVPITVPASPGQQVNQGYANCNDNYYTGHDTCDGNSSGGAYQCKAGEDRTCTDVFDDGCINAHPEWPNARSTYTWKCIPGTPDQAFYILSAATGAAPLVPMTLVPVPANRSIHDWNPVTIYYP